MARQYSSGTSITSITYWRKFAQHRFVYMLLAGIFGFGIVAYFGMGPMGGMGGRRSSPQASNDQTIATVNGEDVSRALFEQQWSNMRRYAGGNDAQGLSFQGMILNNLIENAALRAEAKRRHLSVSDAEVEKALRDMKKGPDGKPIPDEQFQKQLELMGVTENDYRDKLRTDLLPQVLQESVTNSQKIGEKDLLNSYNEYKLRHILISTGKVPDAQAKRKADEAYKEIKAGKDFAALANQITDDPSNKTKFDEKLKKALPVPPQGGELGWAPLTKYVKEFGDAARGMKVGEVSPPVKTQFGYHIINVEAVRPNLPKDYAKNKVKLLDDFKKQQGQTAFSDLRDMVMKSARIEWRDPSMQWKYDYNKTHGMMAGANTGKDDSALIAELRGYLAKNPDDGEASMTLAGLLNQQVMMTPPGAQRDKLRDETIAVYEAALKHAGDQSTHITVAQLYRDAKKNDLALQHYKAAQRLLRWDEGPQSKFTHMQLERAFKDLGHPELAAQETKKIAELDAKEKQDQAEAKKRADAAKAAAGAKVTAPGGTFSVGPGGKVTPGTSLSIAPKPGAAGASGKPVAATSSGKPASATSSGKPTAATPPSGKQ